MYENDALSTMLLLRLFWHPHEWKFHCLGNLQMNYVGSKDPCLAPARLPQLASWFSNSCLVT